MRRKICRIGHSQGICLPKAVLEPLDLEVGSLVELELDAKGRRLILTPAARSLAAKGIDGEFTAQVDAFIQRYRPALEALAKR